MKPSILVTGGAGFIGSHTCVAVGDYIYVVDLANGHVAALKYLQEKAGILTVNLGTGRGISVLGLLRLQDIAPTRKTD